MRLISISEFQRKIRDIQDIALNEPISITLNGQEKYVFLSIEEYQRLKRRDRQVLGVDELSEQDIQDIAAARVSERYDSLNEFLTEQPTF